MKGVIVVAISAGLLFCWSAFAQETPPPSQAPQAAPAASQPLSPRQQDELRADTMMARKRYSEAIEVYKQLLKDQPKNASLLNKVGIAYHHQTDLGQAKRYYERAMKADKQFAHAVNNLGTVYYQRKNYRKAIGLYKQTLAIRPDLAATYSNLGYAYFARKEYDEALQAFQTGLRIDPQLFERRSQTGSLLQQGLSSERAFFFFFLAKSYALMGNVERCAYYLRKAREEGYQKLSDAERDPAFASVIKDPQVQQALHPEAQVAVAPPES